MSIFHLGDVLSVTTGLFLSPTPGLAAIQELLEHMVGEPVWTHQLPRVCDECAPELLRQHPGLATIETPDEFTGKKHVDMWLTEQVTRFGEFLEVTPLRREDHTSIDPLSEMAMNFPDVQVITVEVPR